MIGFWMEPLEVLKRLIRSQQSRDSGKYEERQKLLRSHVVSSAVQANLQPTLERASAAR